MLTCEGYKMFRGTGEIHHAKTGELIETQYGDWLYKPEYDCWYVNGHSYPAECVKVVEDETEATEGGSMSILIKGIDMPKDYGRCMVIFPDGRVTTEFGTQVIASAVPVPPHGDLIDRDAAYDKIAEQEGGNYIDMDAVDKGLEATPVVIPAEEEPND